jgi:hypothetical protein
MMAKHDYDFCVSVIRYWNSEEGHVDSPSGRLVTQEEFRRSHNKKWYRLGKLYKVTTSEAADGLAMEQLKRYDEKSGDWKLVYLHAAIEGWDDGQAGQKNGEDKDRSVEGIIEGLDESYVEPDSAKPASIEGLDDSYVEPETKEADRAACIEGSDDNVEPDNTETDSAAALLSHKKRQETREKADHKRRIVQDTQARKMRRAYAAAASVELGESVVLKVDERDRANHNPLGIQGIVACRAGNGTSVHIATLAGVLTKNRYVSHRRSSAY